MWYLFKDYEETANLVVLVYFSIAIILNYLFAVMVCRKRYNCKKELPIFAACCGLLTSAFFGVVVLNFFLILFVSLLVTWMTIKKLD